MVCSKYYTFILVKLTYIYWLLWILLNIFKTFKINIHYSKTEYSLLLKYVLFNCICYSKFTYYIYYIQNEYALLLNYILIIFKMDIHHF